MKKRDFNRKNKIIRALVYEGGIASLRKIHNLAGGDTTKVNTIRLLSKLKEWGRIGKKGDGVTKGFNSFNVRYYLTREGWEYAIAIGEANFIPSLDYME